MQNALHAGSGMQSVRYEEKHPRKEPMKQETAPVNPAEQSGARRNSGGSYPRNTRQQ